MKNSIDARVEFSFKGETYDLVSHIDLDERLLHGHRQSLHEILARDHHIDTISYLYEVMQEEEIAFSNAQGSAADFLHDGCFDLEGFIVHWRQNHIAALLRPIAKSALGIDDLNRHPDIRNALVLAYKLGREQ